MSYKVSIIIPIFNAEKTIKNLIESVINQTMDFKDIELILVDDKSTDKSKTVIGKYLNRYPNIHYILLNENTGSPSIPRNIGIKISTADYLMFIDSDDEILSDYCETLYNTIVNENADIVSCEYSSKFMDGIYTFPNSSKKKVVIKNKYAFKLVMWGNIFRSGFIKDNDINCPNMSCEDGYFMIKANYLANKIIQLPNYYGYVYTVESENESLTHQKITNNKIYSSINGYLIIKEYLEKNNLPIHEFFDDKITLLLFSFFRLNGSIKEKKEVLMQINQFEKSLKYDITLKSKFIQIFNNLILNEHYSTSIFLSYPIKLMYNHQKIKNFIFKKYFGLIKIDNKGKQ